MPVPVVGPVGFVGFSRLRTSRFCRCWSGRSVFPSEVGSTERYRYEFEFTRFGGIGRQLQMTESAVRGRVRPVNNRIRRVTLPPALFY